VNQLLECLPAIEAGYILHILMDSKNEQLSILSIDNTIWEIIEVDARERFCHDYITKAIKANARYEEGYYLSAALSRPLMAEICVEYLDRLEIDTLIHGFAGNDQLRFEMFINALKPDTEITTVSSLLGSRTDANPNSYTISSNLWGRSVEGGNLCDPWQEPPAEVFEKVHFPVVTMLEPEIHTIKFEKGRVIALDGKEIELVTIIESLETLGHKFGVGYSDIVEDGYIGLKTRAIYEFPAAFALITAHYELERFVSTRLQNIFKPLVDKAWAELVYEGFWFDPQREALEAYIEQVNCWVTGDVKLLYSSNKIDIIGRSSPFTLYDEHQAVYRMGQDSAVDTVGQLASVKALPMRAASDRRRYAATMPQSR
jgi:argininosuccinate synthase